MVQRRHRTSFALEPLTELCLRRLERNDAVEAGVEGLVDLAHATSPDGREDFVRAEFVARR